MSDTTPFTVSTDLDLGTRIAPYLRSSEADVVVNEGIVPERLDQPMEVGGAFEAAVGSFLLKVPNGASFLVEDGRKITYARNGASDRDVALFLLGTAWGALCYQRGLLPLHASGVVLEGRVYAFTGPSGAGKSTLAAALANKGLTFFTDDVLIIDPALIEGSQANCFAGQKDLKLWSDALPLTGATQLAAVRDLAQFEKYFARPSGSEGAMRGSLTGLVVLRSESGRRSRDPVAISSVKGSAAIKLLRESIYRLRIGSAIMGRQQIYSTLARLIAAVQVHVFDRPIDKSTFAQSTDAIHDWIVVHGQRRDG